MDVTPKFGMYVISYRRFVDKPMTGWMTAGTAVTVLSHGGTAVTAFVVSSGATKAYAKPGRRLSSAIVNDMIALFNTLIVSYLIASKQ